MVLDGADLHVGQGQTDASLLVAQLALWQLFAAAALTLSSADAKLVQQCIIELQQLTQQGMQPVRELTIDGPTKPPQFAMLLMSATPVAAAGPCRHKLAADLQLTHSGVAQVADPEAEHADARATCLHCSWCIEANW